MLRQIRSKLTIRARRFGRAQDGATAVEFALVATPFLALLFAIVETALVFFADQTLEAAVSETSRLIMTGQAQTNGYSQADFKTAVCNYLTSTMFDCSSGVYVDVKSYSSFSAINNNPPIVNGQFDTSNMAYTPGGPGEIVVVRLYYQWPITVSLLGDNLSTLNGNKRLLIAPPDLRNN